MDIIAVYCCPLNFKTAVMSEKVCKILLRPSPQAWGTPSLRGICDVDSYLSFYLIFGLRVKYTPEIGFNLLKFIALGLMVKCTPERGHNALFFI